MIRVDLSPVRVTEVADLVGLDDVFGLVVVPHQDKVLFAGSAWKGHLDCNLFEIKPSSGDFKMILPHCAMGGISPDGGKMLVERARGLGLAILDLGTDSVVPIASGLPVGSVLWKGSWSPDGKWIAALQIDPASEQARIRRNRTIRIDAHDFSQRRDMGGEGDASVTWSPDSRYLLYNEGPILLTMDIESGKRVIVKGSKGANGGPNIGWVSLDVLTEGGGH
jgi:WD40-like Beta Propeller Repeat